MFIFLTVSRTTILFVYVDDIVVTCSHYTYLCELIGLLNSKFALKV